MGSTRHLFKMKISNLSERFQFATRVYVNFFGLKELIRRIDISSIINHNKFISLQYENYF